MVTITDRVGIAIADLKLPQSQRVHAKDCLNTCVWGAAIRMEVQRQSG